MKYPRACHYCRESKRKCNPRALGQSCDTCLQRGLECDGELRSHADTHKALLPRDASNESNPAQPYGRVEQDEASFLPHGMAVELVEHYLDKLHLRPHSIFHPATLRSRVRTGTVGKALLYAVCALGSKFSANPDARGREARLVEESKRLLQADIENVCLENIQTSVLIATWCVGHGNGSSEALFFRIGVAMSDIMGLSSSTLGDSIAERETRRRTWWSLYAIDRWCISGLGMPSQMQDLTAVMELPMDENIYHSTSPDQRTLYGPWRPGLWAHIVSLAPLFGSIQYLNQCIARDDTQTTKLGQEVEHISQQLESWRDMLPMDARMTPENLHRQQNRGLGGLLISIHLAYHHYSTLLYFRFLEDPPSKDHKYVARCRSHASSFSALIRQSRQLKGCEAVYPLVGHMTTVSSSVLVHTLLFGDVHELQKTREELNSNFEALMELRQYWPATSAMINRLIKFQNTCLLSTAPRTHRLDGWMVRFLFEHSLLLNGRDTVRSSSGVDIELETIVSKTREFSERGRFMDFNFELID
ncbi:hypothetical protein GQ53DRAFT_707720 [Thozetella sp. PMI_491]|nr:hypothetical protein GQ53DRAFT_707720 [Thozetella sp. PMI_491]